MLKVQSEADENGQTFWLQWPLLLDSSGNKMWKTQMHH